MNKIIDTPAPPYFAVIAPAELSLDIEGYAEMASKMLALAREQPGFLGLEASISGGLMMAVSYWESLEAIDAWRGNAHHLVAKDEGKQRWFSRYLTRIARVEQVY